MKNTLLTLLITFFGLISYSQKAKQWVAMGDESWEKKDWYAAKIYYEKAFLLDSANFRWNVKFAESLRMTKEYSKAGYYYEKLYQKDKGKVFPKGLYWLAVMQKYNENYSDALRNFKKYNKKQRKDKKGFEYLKSKQEIASCKWAVNARKDEGKIEVTNIDEPINTTDSEFAAWLVDSTLYYSTMKSVNSNLPVQGKVKIYQADFDSLANNVEIGKYNSSSQHQANVSFSLDGKTVYYSKCDSLTGCFIYQAEVVDGEWENEEMVDGINAIGSNSTMPNIALVNGNEVLFFASNRERGKGKMDIWWSLKKEGRFSKPQNAGDKINSIDDEITPFYLGEKLYFSSNWHAGFGGFDVFVSEGITNEFQEPENAGFPINSSVNDMYYTYFVNQNKGFITSNRAGSLNDGTTYCCNDIWQLVYEDSCRVEQDTLAYQTLAELNRYLPVTLYFHNDEPNPRTLDTTTTLSYLDSYRSYLALEEKYGKESSKGMSGDGKEQALYDVEDFFDFFVKKGVQDLEIFSELLLKELQEGSLIKLSVRGFASPLADSDYNVNLTKRRISSLVNYLNNYRSGILLPYLDNTSLDEGKLEIQEIPFGEFQADNQVSDASSNKKESIYSRGARMERKIEIMSVERMATDSLYPEIGFDKEVFNFGVINAFEEVSHRFKIINTGGSVLEIDSVEVSCGCTIPKLDVTELAPGEDTELIVVFDPKGKYGLQTIEILVHSNVSEEPKILTFTAEIR